MKLFSFTAAALAVAWLTSGITATAQSSLDAGDEGRTIRIPMSAERYSQLYWDTDENGTIWVRGRCYKASFGAQGATYYPLFGSEQPRHFPVALSLASATSNGEPIALEPVNGAVRDGDRVVIDRGVIDEVYELGVEGVEQTFVVDGRPLGDLQLQVGIVTELAAAQHVDGFEFANEFGAVRYGRAFVRESAHTKRALDTELVEGGITIALDADYLSTAQFPLVVDPLITTFDVDVTAFENNWPSVAYDLTNDRYLYVYEETPVALDSDVHSRLVSGAGVVLSGAYVDVTTDDWVGCSVANLNAYDQFLVISDVGALSPGAFTPARVRGRLTNASALSYGTAFTIIEGGRFGSLGGDPFASTPSYYCVAYQPTGGLDGGIAARLVTNLGTLVGAAQLVLDPGAPGGVFISPQVSHSNGGSRWNIVWQVGFTSANSDIYGAQVQWNGVIATPKFPIAATAAEDANPRVASPFENGEYAVTWNRDFGTDWDVMGAVISGGTLLSTQNLTVLEGGTHLLQDQHVSDVDCDGQHIAFIYGDQTSPAGISQQYISSFHSFSGALQPSEVHVPLAIANWSGQLIATASAGGAPARFGLAWSNQDTDNIFGAFYDGLVGGPIGTACAGDGSGTACPCANSGSAGRGCGNSANSTGARLQGAGQADLTSDTVVLTATGVPPGAPCLYFQGTILYSSGAGVVLGDGLLCATGAISRIAVKFASGTTSTFPAAGDPNLSTASAMTISGGLRYYQGWYRDSAVFCTSSTFNLTNAVSVMWLP